MGVGLQEVCVSYSMSLISSSHKLPKNEAFDAYPSDGLGCDYGNNWNSIHYGKTPRGDIAMQLRSAKDSYLFASAYTRGCSNDHLEPAKCFGPTQREEEMGVFICLHVCFGLVVVEILVGSDRLCYDYG